ncbi:MAG: helix-turn-helix domain-containing protein [Lactobacillaceae bacterium]|jgi:transcriptional regulator with XRE-family HTH domain|nr:helix-turn-helix domain-containing protein [Lactobacillaceae bacterium]
MSGFGELIKNYRIDNHYSQSSLANKLFISQQTLSDWENKNHHPNFLEMQRILKILKINISELDN